MITTVTGTIGLLVAALIIYLMRKDRLHITHGMGWVILAILFALLGFAPKVFDRIAGVLQVEYPPVLALILGMSALVLKILLMDIERSKIEIKNQRLIQRVAMLEADIRLLQESERSEKPVND